MTRLTIIFLTVFSSTIAFAQQRPIDKELLEAVQNKDIPKINLLLSQGANVNVRSEIELAWHKAMSAAMTSKEGDLLPFEHTEHVCVGWRAEWSVLRDFMNVSEAGHVVEPTAANNTDFCLRQDCPSKECSEPRLYNPRLPNFPNIRPTQQ